MSRRLDPREVVLIFRRTDQRVTPTGRTRSSRFRVTDTEIRRDLRAEAAHLDAEVVYILLDAPEHAFRQDGELRAGTRIDHPGVTVIVQTPQGPLRFPCATYPRWTDNLCAVVRSLEALRAVDRHGVTRGNEQYRGWSALPAAAAPEEGDPWTTLDGAVRWLHEQAGMAPPARIPSAAPPEYCQDAYRRAARRHHPDAGGDARTFARVARCKEFIDGCFAAARRAEGGTS